MNERVQKLIEKKVGAIYQNTTPLPEFKRVCAHCEGKGYLNEDQGEIECPTCEGSGEE